MPPPDHKPITRMDPMTEAAYTSPKAKSKPASTSAASAFELPKFELPNFEIPKMEIPAAFREIAEKSVSQAKENYEKMKSAAEEATDVLEDTYATATKGASEYGLKCIEAARANTNATFDFYGGADDREVVLRGGRALHRACAQAVRDGHRADQGPHRARPEGRDRDRRAAQGQRHQGVPEGRLRT